MLTGQPHLLGVATLTLTLINGVQFDLKLCIVGIPHSPKPKIPLDRIDQPLHIQTNKLIQQFLAHLHPHIPQLLIIEFPLVILTRHKHPYTLIEHLALEVVDSHEEFAGGVGELDLLAEDLGEVLVAV